MVFRPSYGKVIVASVVISWTLLGTLATYLGVSELYFTQVSMACSPENTQRCSYDC